MFSAVQRAGYLGASDMRYVMNSVAPAALMRWFEVKIGLREPDPPTYAMKLGSFVGDFILDEYELQTNDLISRRQEVVPSPTNKRFRSTLDGFSETRNAVIEAKFASAFFPTEQIFSTYYPQVAMQMHCTNADVGYLVVAQGTNEPFEIECMRNTEYEAVLLQRAEQMLECLDTLTPPIAIEAPVIVPPEKWRTVDLDVETPNWRDELIENLAVYDDTRPIWMAHEVAGKAARTLIPDDVGKVLAGEFTLARNKKGVVVITRRKS